MPHARQHLPYQRPVRRAQGVGRATQAHIRQAVHSVVKAGVYLQIQPGIAHETRLLRLGRLGAEAAVGIQAGQKRQCDAGFFSRGDAAQTHLGGLRIRRAVHAVVQIVKLRHRGIAALEHLHIGQPGHRLEALGPDRADHPVHLFPPAHEIARSGSRFRQSGHQPLMRVRMCVGNARDGDTPNHLRLRAWLSGRQLADQAQSVNLHQHVPAPPRVR